MILSQRPILVIFVTVVLMAIFAIWIQQEQQSSRSHTQQLQQTTSQLKNELKRLRDDHHAQITVLDAKLHDTLQVIQNLTAMERTVQKVSKRLDKAVAQIQSPGSHQHYSSFRCTNDADAIHHICTFYNLYLHPGGQFVYFQNPQDSTPPTRVVLSQRIIGNVPHETLTPTAVRDPPKFTKTINEPMALMCGTGNDNHAHNYQEMEGPMFWLLSLVHRATDLNPAATWIYFHTCNGFPVNLYGQNTQEPKLFLAHRHEEVFRPLYTARRIVTAANLASVLGADHVRVREVTMGMWATATIGTQAPFRPEAEMQTNGVLWTDYLLRKLGLRSKFDGPSASDAILVLQRTRTRKIVNANELIQRLRQEFPQENILGPETFEHKSIELQMNITRHAKVIISAHGAQLSNGLFAPLGATIIELLNFGCEREVGGIPNKYPLAFKSVMTEYTTVVHHTQRDHEGCSGAQFEGDINANIDEIVQIVRNSIVAYPKATQLALERAQQLRTEFVTNPPLPARLVEDDED